MKITSFVIALFLAAIAAGSLLAMPPRDGISEPKALQDLKEQGIIDNPGQGLMAEHGLPKVSGTRTYPVVMGYFTDQASSYTQAQFQTQLFSTASGAKSVTNYYKDMSYNTMTCTGTVNPWGSSGNTKSYFANGNYGISNTYPKNTPGFIYALLAALDATVNFADPAFDVNNDYYVDVLWVVHSGKGAEETNSTSDIWSHSSQMTNWSGVAAYATNDYRNGNRVYINKYIIMPEKTNYADGSTSTTEMIGVGVFCHEFGHALGLPDLYDTGGYDGVSGQGLGHWSVMAGGSWGGNGITNGTPVSLDVWSKRYLGWASPANITANTSGTTVASILNTQTNSSYRLAKNGGTSETQYWLIENRYKSASGPVSGVTWDAYLPGSGLAVYHIDETYAGYSTTYFTGNKVNVNSTTGSSRNRPYGVALEETDMTTAGYSGSELYTGANSGEAVDVFNSSTQASFDSVGTAYPISYKNDGSTKSGISIASISAAGASMTASFRINSGTTATPTLAVSMASWSPAAAGGTSGTVNVTNSGTTSVIAYTVSSNQTWLTVSAASGNTPGSFTMTAAVNTGAARSATVTITATTSGVAGSPKTISVTQAAASGQNDAGTGGDAGNTIATATLVNPGSWTGCYLDATDRNDYYKFNVTSGQVIKVKITPPSAADFDLYLHNPSQTQVGSSTRGAGLVDSIVYTANATGYWYCRAYQYSGTGNYSLQISVSGGTTGTWTTVTSTTQSAHPYTNSYNYTWTITGPSSATKMKVYFDSIKVETGYDTVFVLNGSGTVIQKWTGTYRAIWSNEVTGNVIKIKLKTDATVTGYGFLSTKYQHYTTTASSPADPFGDEENAPAELLSQNHPNPVVGRTTFTYNLPDDRQASLRVYNIAGQHVRTVATGLQKAGRHSIEWDARDEYGRPVANGTYIYRLEAGDLGATRKMLILK